MPPTTQLSVLSDKMLKLKRELESARTHQERRHQDWDDNYELYRNKVRTNRLTQRQTVNLPLMKETIKTVLSKIDDPPQVDWKETSNDEDKEIIFQQLWEDHYREDKLEWIDVLDKKNVLLYGLSTKILYPDDDGICTKVLDVFDVVFDPLMDPFDIESARYIIRQNIFKSLREILADDRYSEEGKTALKIWADTPQALIQSAQNVEEWNKKMERALAMGVDTADFATFAGGDVLINICEHYTKMWNAETKKFEKHVVVYADQWAELMDEKLEDLIGIDDYPFVVWFEDPETNDIYPDGVADLVRTPNKVLNVWYSQMIENRTLQNFQMHWYDATTEYTPQTYEPGPGRMLPAPGDPNKTIMPVQINGLDETLTAIQYVTGIIERGSGAVAIDKGVSQQGAQTLGEVQILMGKAMERSLTMQKFYRGSWREYAEKWKDLMHANPPSTKTLYRKGTSGKLYEKKVTPDMWKGHYEPEVTSTSEAEANNVKTVQKFMFVMSQFPDNTALKKIAQRRQLELLDFSPDELRQVQEAEKEMEQQLQEQQLQQQPMMGAEQQMPAQPQQPVQSPEEAQLLQGLEESMAQLGP